MGDFTFGEVPHFFSFFFFPFLFLFFEDTVMSFSAPGGMKRKKLRISLFISTRREKYTNTFLRTSKHIPIRTVIYR